MVSNLRARSSALRCKTRGGRKSASMAVGAGLQGVRSRCKSASTAVSAQCKECGGGGICEHGCQRLGARSAAGRPRRQRSSCPQICGTRSPPCNGRRALHCGRAEHASPLQGVRRVISICALDDSRRQFSHRRTPRSFSPSASRAPAPPATTPPRLATSSALASFPDSSRASASNSGG